MHLSVCGSRPTRREFINRAARGAGLAALGGIIVLTLRGRPVVWWDRSCPRTADCASCRQRAGCPLPAARAARKEVARS